MRIGLAEALTAVDGRLWGALAPDVVFDAVGTDTRTLRPGCLFVALAGPHHDAHEFLAEAARKGAAAAVVHRDDAPPGLPVIRVPDTLVALGRLGRAVRRRLGLAVVAVTGSVGKTTTKEMTAALLREDGRRTLQTPGNWNNRVGLPLTLLGARGDEQAAVLELGVSELGEMVHLATIAEPDVAVVTAVTPCHTEGLGSLEAVAREKLSVAGGLRPGGTLVLPHGDPLLTPPPDVRVLTFGWEPGADVRGEGFESLGAQGSRFSVAGLVVHLHLPGRHNAENALAALAATRALGASWKGAAAALASLRPMPLRGEVRHTPGGIHLLVDCYNANPAAVDAALATLEDLAEGARRIAVLGEMRELGTLAETAHLEVGRAAVRHGVGELHLLGRDTAWIREGAAAEGLAAERIWMYDDREALAASLTRRLRPGDWVLIKASRALGLERVAETLDARESFSPGR